MIYIYFRLYLSFIPAVHFWRDLCPGTRITVYNAHHRNTQEVGPNRGHRKLCYAYNMFIYVCLESDIIYNYGIMKLTTHLKNMLCIVGGVILLFI